MFRSGHSTELSDEEGLRIGRPQDDPPSKGTRSTSPALKIIYHPAKQLNEKEQGKPIARAWSSHISLPEDLEDSGKMQW
jgi:hypothetical protein